MTAQPGQLDLSNYQPDDDATLIGVGSMSLRTAVWKAIERATACGEYERRADAHLEENARAGLSASAMFDPQFLIAIRRDSDGSELGIGDIRRLAAMPAFQKNAYEERLRRLAS